MATLVPSRSRSRKRKIVIAVHGIRTHGEWTTHISHLFRTKTDYEFWALNYWPFDALDLFLPGPFWKKRRARLLDLLQEAKSTGADVSVIAHSFGTFLTVSALKKSPHIILEKLVLCGSIVKNRDLSAFIRKQVQTEIINDCGTKDIWPCLAEILSKSYHATGVRGFGAPVIDRFFPIKHSDFLDKNFARIYWIPIFQGATHGKLRHGPPAKRSYPRSIRILMWLASLRKKLLIAAGALVILFGFLYVFSNICWLSTCKIAMEVSRDVSFAEAACYGGKRVYSSFIQDKIEFDGFLKSYEARWYFDKDKNGRPLHNPPVVIDLNNSGPPLIPEDNAHDQKPFYSYRTTVSWLRTTKLQWDFRDVADEPGGVGYTGRFPIKRFAFKVRLPRGMEIEKCEDCRNLIDGLVFSDSSNSININARSQCRVISDGSQISCVNINLPAETKITYGFNIKGWARCE